MGSLPSQSLGKRRVPQRGEYSTANDIISLFRRALSTGTRFPRLLPWARPDYRRNGANCDRIRRLISLPHILPPFVRCILFVSCIDFLDLILDCILLLFLKKGRSKVARLHGHLVPHPARRDLNILRARSKFTGLPLSPPRSRHHRHHHRCTHLLRVLLGGLAGLGAAGLLGRKVLLGLLGTTDGAHTGNGLLAEVSAVAVLGSLVGNTLVDPARSHPPVSTVGLQYHDGQSRVISRLLTCGCQPWGRRSR